MWSLPISAHQPQATFNPTPAGMQEPRDQRNAAAASRRRMPRLDLPGSTPLPHSYDSPPSRLMPAMRLLLETDASRRLAIFTTRPAIYCLPLNLLTEFLATGVFVLILLLLWQQARFIGTCALSQAAGEAACAVARASHAMHCMSGPAWLSWLEPLRLLEPPPLPPCSMMAG
jgi:hypothetical protein